MTDYFVHESAYVDAGATIGAGTRVWHFCHVMPGAVIGQRCTLGQNVVVMASVRIGNDVKIQNNVSVYEGVTLEDHVFCGPSCVFTNVINPRSEVSRRDEYQTTLVRRGATIGANATILCGATIGEYAFIGAGAVIRGDVAPYALMLGVPARPAGWMCRCGVRLSVVNGAATCQACGRGYREEAERLVPIHE
jgi:UDP-2-acetamido-3-amino-2,3-dideoxy-glucuronate N-acetyltransferase